MFTTARMFHDIVLHMSVYRYVIKSNCKRNLYDLNKQSENFFMRLLNIVYGYQLHNLNVEKKNFEHIDLGDDDRKIAIQVTSQNRARKIRDTVTGFVDSGLSRRFSRLIILIIGDKLVYQHASYVAGQVSDFAFNKDKDIQDIDDLLGDIENLDIEIMAQVHEFVTFELEAVSRSLSPNSLIFEAPARPNCPPLTAERFFRSVGFNEDFEDRESLFQSLLKVYKNISDLSETLRSFLSICVERGHAQRYHGEDYWTISIGELGRFAKVTKQEAWSLYGDLSRFNLVRVEEDEPELVWLVSRVGEANFFPYLKEFLKTDELIKRAIIDADFTVLD